jgi:hypothetical protein
MNTIVKVALGVFFGILLWEKRDAIGWFALAGIAVVVLLWAIVSIFKKSVQYIDEFGRKKFSMKLAKELKNLGFAEGMGLQSLALIFERHEYRWEIDGLMANVDKLKIRTSNGYDTSDERDDIERSLKRIVKEIKENGWDANHVV